MILHILFDMFIVMIKTFGNNLLLLVNMRWPYGTSESISQVKVSQCMNKVRCSCNNVSGNERYHINLLLLSIGFELMKIDN